MGKKKTLRAKIANGDEDMHSKLKIAKLRLIITTEITGYTCQYIYGSHDDLDLDSIVVPTYRLKVEKEGEVIASYHVTRDSWYSRGVLNDNWGPFDDIELSNRCFEPADGNVNLYSVVATAYPPGAGVDALALRQNGSERLKAVAHTIRMQTFVNGTPIDDPRSNLSIATDVMIHIGGWYNNGSENKLSGSYGCFAIIPNAQRKDTISQANAVREENLYRSYTTSNQAYKVAIDYIVQQAGGAKNIHVVVEKRHGVEQLRILKNQ